MPHTRETSAFLGLLCILVLLAPAGCGAKSGADTPSGDGVALAVLVGAHRGYLFTDAENQPVSQQTAALRALEPIFTAMSPADRVAIYVYDESGHRQLVPWSAPSALAKALASLPAAPLPDTFDAPPLAEALAGVVADVASDTTPLPRRALLVITDGKDRDNDDPEALTASLAALATSLKESQVALAIAGYTLDVEQPLAHFEALAGRASGAYALMPGEIDPAALTPALHNLVKPLLSR